MNKSETEREYKRILHSHTIGKTLPENETRFLMEHLRFHKDWNTKKCPHPLTITKIEVGKAAQHLPHPCFILTRSDGTKDDISYKTALEGEFPPKRRKNIMGYDDIKAACRSAIEPLISRVRDYVMEQVDEGNNTFVSPLTGKTFTIEKRSDFHIDHYDLTFDEVVRNWIDERHPELKNNSEQYVCSTNFENGNHNSSKFKDSDLARDFFDYHRRNTHIRVLPVRENLSEAKKAK